MSHIPVMLDEVIAALAPKDGDIIVDGTYGGGSYTQRILDHANCKVIAIDRDKDAFDRAVEAAQSNKRLTPIHGRFSEMDALVSAQKIDKVDGVVLDIGVSSYQIDEAERGFSFQKDGPLDMRMDKTQGQTAADLVNEVCEQELADIFFKYGQERHSRKVARAIVAYRLEQPFKTTKELADVIKGVLPFSRKDKQHPATRCFQALRIAVNDELGELERGLAAAEVILKENGRLVVVTFHSLEDGIVKDFLRERAGQMPSGSRYLPETKKEEHSTFVLKEKKAVEVSDNEAQINTRARSAKLRWALRSGEMARAAA